MSEVISNFFGNIVLSITNISFVNIVSKKKLERSKIFILIFIFIMSVFQTLIFIFDKGILKTLVMFAIYMINHKALYKLSWKKTIFLTIMYAIFLLIPDIILIIVCTTILGMTKQYCYEVFAGSFLSNLLVCAILLIITYIFRNFFNKILNIKLDKNIKIIIISGLVLLSLGIMFYNSFSFIIYNLETMIILIIIAIFIVVLFTLIKERLNNDNLKEQYDKLLEFMVTYEKEVEEQRILRHENKNNLIAIKSKIIDKDNEKEIVSYIDELLNISTKIKNEKYAKFGYLPSNGLKGLFYYKTDEAENKGIKFSINISKDIKKSVISNMETKNFRLLGNIIGVFLDNAIEASFNSNEKKMGIEIYKNKKNVEILISNSYNTKLDIKKIGFISYSTKGKNRGHGLLLVNSIIKSNKIFENEKVITNDIFTQKLIVKKLEK